MSLSKEWSEFSAVFKNSCIVATEIQHMQAEIFGVMFLQHIWC